MSQAQPLSFLVLGAQSLTVECGEILLARGHAIPAVVTDAQDVRAWAEARGLAVHSPGADLAARLGALEVDWLVSAANLRIVPDDVLAKARRGGLNFHDGPLPRYAGLHATSWALLAGERTHGVTWHLIEGGVDEGRICAQRELEVADDETALGLDAKCFALGVETFRELVEAIEAGTLSPRAQDLGARTYFARHDRPSAMATIDWSRPARELHALVRALDFGTRDNPLAVAKARVGDRVLLVRAARVVERGGAPGEVLEAGTDAVVVACGDGALALTALADADGSPIALAEIEAGARFESLGPAARDRLSAIHRELCGHEGWWAARLSAHDCVIPQASAASGSPAHVVTPLGKLDVEALVVALARLADVDTVRIGWSDPATRERASELEGWVAPVVPLRVVIDDTTTVERARSAVRAELAAMREHPTFARDLRARRRAIDPARESVTIVGHAQLPDAPQALGALLTVHVAEDGSAVLVRDTSRLCERGLASLEAQLGVLLETIARAPEQRVRSLSVLPGADRDRLLVDFNRTAIDVPEVCLHRLFEAQVDRTPDAIALAFEGETLTYRALDGRANALAHRLRALGVGPERLVGVAVERSLELVVAVLGILKAGGAYLPLDPAFPRERVEMMLEDSGAEIVVTQRALASRFAHATTVAIDEMRSLESKTRVEDDGARPEHLAYVLYTSGSTGRPKGVMVEHRQVANFFTGMDARIEHEPPGVWLAVTSLSFDISVLELLWTLARGFRVVVHRDRAREEGAAAAPEIAARPMDFGLCYWGNDDRPGKGKYELLLEGARFADAHGFHAVWTPERHFHAFGGPFPNPSVSGAAVAAITKNLDVRAASVVLPLHHPVRVAEEWAMIDNLTEGRVGLGIAAGWQPDDFVLRPENTPPAAKDAMFRDIEVLRRLWRGESVEFPRQDGSLHAVVSQPRPVQRELPIWLTIALNPESYRQAADIGANVLTHLLGQSVDELAGKIRIYRDRLSELGKDPASGKVTLMLHTFVASDREVAREAAREPLKKYLASAASLIKQYVWMFPALKRPHGASSPDNIDLGTLDAEETDAVLEYAFHRYFEESGLLGSVEDCVARVQQLKAIGVDEIACLIDFGVETGTVLASLPELAEVVAKTSRPAPVVEHTFARSVAEHGVTHLQCTPSLARMLLLDDASRAALGRVTHLMIGGEALPATLAAELRRAGVPHVENMYGPTETTVWSSTDTVEGDEITLGIPIANTTFYVLDERQRLAPMGAAGELWIGGRGVARGYLHRPELTRERFVPDPFSSEPGARMYRTGDRVRWREDGRLEFLGRVDHQVKVRGHRIELGEIEAALASCPGVREAVVVARPGPSGETELVGYVTAREVAVDVAAMREHLRATLPSVMIPSRFVTLERFPLTPNKKVDRQALPAPEASAEAASEPGSAPPASDLERDVAAIWSEVLGAGQVGRDDNFFELGGHSLLAVRLHRRLVEALARPIAMTDVFRFPTVRSFAAQLGGSAEADTQLDAVASRAAARRAARRR